MPQQTSIEFIIGCILFVLLFGYGALEQWRENNRKRSIEEDIKEKFNKVNKTGKYSKGKK